MSNASTCAFAAGQIATFPFVSSGGDVDVGGCLPTLLVSNKTAGQGIVLIFAKMMSLQKLAFFATRQLR